MNTQTTNYSVSALDGAFIQYLSTKYEGHRVLTHIITHDARCLQPGK